jgi:enoyl-CoA hydratase/carnithine racemase
MSDAILLNVEGHIATVILNRPEMMNAFNAESYEELLVPPVKSGKITK